MNINKEDIEWQVAKAMVKLETELLGMGDSYDEVTSWLCGEAGISFDEEGYHEIDYFKRVNKKAYYIILKEKDPKDILESNLEYFLDNKDSLMSNVSYYKNVTNECNPIVKSIKTILNYVDSLRLENKCDSKLVDLAIKLYSNFNEINLRAINYGRDFGKEFYKLLNDKTFSISNNCFVIGDIPSEYDDEFTLGDYICHCEFKENREEGYTIAFSKKKNKYIANIYKYSKSRNPYKIDNKDLGITYEIKDKKTYINDIVKILNDFK